MKNRSGFLGFVIFLFLSLSLILFIWFQGREMMILYFEKLNVPNTEKKSYFSEVISKNFILKSFLLIFSFVSVPSIFRYFRKKKGEEEKFWKDFYKENEDWNNLTLKFKEMLGKSYVPETEVISPEIVIENIGGVTDHVLTRLERLIQEGKNSLSRQPTEEDISSRLRDTPSPLDTVFINSLEELIDSSVEETSEIDE